VAVVVIAGFKDGKISHEHIYWVASRPVASRPVVHRPEVAQPGGHRPGGHRPGGPTRSQTRAPRARQLQAR
jgi:hypothetical protein